MVDLLDNFLNSLKVFLALASNHSEEPSSSYSRFPEIIGTHRTFNDRQLLKMAENG